MAQVSGLIGRVVEMAGKGRNHGVTHGSLTCLGLFSMPVGYDL